MFFIKLPLPPQRSSLVSCFESSLQLSMKNTAILRKVVGKGARGKPERYCGWFWVRCSSKKFERRVQEAVDVCLRVLKESSKRSFDSYSVRNSVFIISHIAFRDCRVHIFVDNLFRNSTYTFIFSSILRTFSGLFLHFPGVIYSRFGGVVFALSLQRKQIFFSNQLIEFSCKNHHQVRAVLHRVPVKEIQSKWRNFGPRDRKKRYPGNEVVYDTGQSEFKVNTRSLRGTAVSVGRAK